MIDKCKTKMHNQKFNWKKKKNRNKKQKTSINLLPSSSSLTFCVDGNAWLKVTGFCRSPQETRKSSPTGSVTSSVSNAALTPSRQLTDAEKLRKVILELVDTERTYVKVSCIYSRLLLSQYKILNNLLKKDF